MDSERKAMFSKFNLSGYGEVLESAKSAGYEFIDFSALNLEVPYFSFESKCLLRHDIDVDLSAAYQMAKVEHDLGVSSTYFLMLRSPVYNLMARHNHTLVNNILGLGHSIGLHYDQGFDQLRGLACAETTELLEGEAQWLEQQFNCPVAAVSFHQPGSAVLQGKIFTGNRINTYDRDRLAGFEYFSDSNRSFPLLPENSSCIGEAFETRAPKNLQLLIHPMWWVYEDATTEAVWNRAISSNFGMMQKQLLETERAYGTPRDFVVQASMCK